MTARNPKDAERDEQAALWCLALVEGELPPEQREAFDRWIADADNRRALDEAATLWNMIDGAAATPELVHMRSAALDAFTAANRRRWTRRMPARWTLAAAAAATILLALLSVALLHDPSEVYRTGIGERRVAMLEDGSKLSLDADTEVGVRLGKDRRELTLVHGRAKFDVAHDPLKPFEVNAGDKIVVATGTSFSVELLGSNVQVLLYEGRVAVLDSRDDKPIRPRAGNPIRGAAGDEALTPGRALTARIGTADGAVIAEMDGQQSLSWESGQLSFDDEPLPGAIARMNRYSKDKLAIGDPDLASLRVNGVFTAGDNEAFLEGISALNPVRVSREPGRIVLRSR